MSERMRKIEAWWKKHVIYVLNELRRANEKHNSYKKEKYV